MSNPKVYLFVNDDHVWQVTLDRRALGLVVSRASSTNVTNVLHVLLFVVGLSWPPIRWMSYFLEEERG